MRKWFLVGMYSQHFEYEIFSVCIANASALFHYSMNMETDSNAVGSHMLLVRGVNDSPA